MKPASTSPEPAVASQGEPFRFTAARPSGAAITVSGPFSSTTAPARRAASRAAVIRSGEAGQQAREQPLELAGMRRQDVVAVEHREQLLRIVAEDW
jgi:hypothetical protein